MTQKMEQLHELTWFDEDKGEAIKVYWWMSPKGYWYRQYVTRTHEGKIKRISEREVINLFDEYYNA